MKFRDFLESRQKSVNRKTQAKLLELKEDGLFQNEHKLGSMQNEDVQDYRSSHEMNVLKAPKSSIIIT